MLMSLRYPHAALLENAVAATFPEELAACHYTCLAVEQEFREQLGDRSSTFLSCWPALWYTQANMSNWKSAGACRQLPCSLGLAVKTEKYRGTQQQFLPLYVPRRSFLGSFHMPNIQKLLPTDLKPFSTNCMSHFSPGKSETRSDEREWTGGGDTVSMQSCEGPYHFSSTGMQIVLLARAWLNAEWNQHCMLPLASVVADYVLNGYVEYKRVKCTGFDGWFYSVLFQRHLFYQKREELVSWVF